MKQALHQHHCISLPTRRLLIHNFHSTLQHIPLLAMADPSMQVPETLQAASIKQNPSPKRDINPSTSTSGKHLVPEDDAHSIPSDVVDPSRMIRPVPRRSNLPPLPDLRFEQSYLASLKDAESWGRVAWITIRDQVCKHNRTLVTGRDSLPSLVKRASIFRTVD